MNPLIVMAVMTAVQSYSQSVTAGGNLDVAKILGQSELELSAIEADSARVLSDIQAALILDISGIQKDMAVSLGKLQSLLSDNEVDINRAIAGANEAMAMMRVDDAIDRGHRTEAYIRQRGKQLVGTRRAALAAQGLDPDAGSAADVQQEAIDITEVDVMTTTNNAHREAFGYRVEAIQSSMQGELGSLASKYAGEVANLAMTKGAALETARGKAEASTTRAMGANKAGTILGMGKVRATQIGTQGAVAYGQAKMQIADTFFSNAMQMYSMYSTANPGSTTKKVT